MAYKRIPVAAPHMTLACALVPAHTSTNAHMRWLKDIFHADAAPHMTLACALVQAHALTRAHMRWFH